MFFFYLILQYDRLKFEIDSNYWRITSVNSEYKLCPSYPRYLIVPASVSDQTLETAAKFRSSRRVPAVVWRWVNLQCDDYTFICTKNVFRFFKHFGPFTGIKKMEWLLPGAVNRKSVGWDGGLKRTRNWWNVLQKLAFRVVLLRPVLNVILRG